MEKGAKIYVAGHTGLVGSALLRGLERKGYSNFVFTPYPGIDLTVQKAVDDFFRREKPEYVFLAAAKVGGIVANNTYRAQFIYENLQIQNNIIHHAYLCGVKKLLFLGSSCIYPKECPQPIREEYMLTGELEYTNEAYAVAKIAGMKMCEAYNLQYGTDYIPVMPTNLYGPNDNYDLEKSHVLPALIRKMHLGKCLEQNDWEGLRADLDARPIEGVDGRRNEREVLAVLDKYGIRTNSGRVTVTLWGTGSPKREFLHSDDLADACVYLMENVGFGDLSGPPGRTVRNSHINIGTGIDLTIRELAELVRSVTGFGGELVWDESKPDGTPQKLLNVDKVHSLGWKHTITLEEGISRVYGSYTDKS